MIGAHPNVVIQIDPGIIQTLRNLARGLSHAGVLFRGHFG